MKYTKEIAEKSLDIILMEIRTVKSIQTKLDLKKNYTLAYIPYREIVSKNYQNHYLRFIKEVGV